MRLPQIILIVWIALAFGIHLANHGYALISGGLKIWLLYWGGFFN